MINQLVTIRFEQRDQSVSVDWYHVPRKGDGIAVGKDDDGKPQIVGVAYSVVWSDDIVLVEVVDVNDLERRR